MVTKNIRFEDGHLTGSTTVTVNEGGHTTTFRRDSDRLVRTSGALRHRILSELAHAGPSGRLTCQLAKVVFGPNAPASRATTRCRTLARQGLTYRHESNDQRWYITEAGRAALITRDRDG